MKVINHVNPSEQQMEWLLEPGHNEPIYMVNLLKFKEKAVYADGRDTELTGAQAFAIYGEAVARIIMGLGGGPMFSAAVTGLMLGEVDELWDAIAIGMYPSRKTIHDMISSPEYQEIAIHRDAGLAGQLNIETTNPAGLWPMQQGAGSS